MDGHRFGIDGRMEGVLLEFIKFENFKRYHYGIRQNSTQNPQPSPKYPLRFVLKTKTPLNAIHAHIISPFHLQYHYSNSHTRS